MVAIKEISKASKLILETVPVSPVLTSQILDREFGCSLYFKCENLQPVGSFKARGAINAIGQLTNEELKRGVVTHSSGNHARALAWAAAGRGTPCYVVMPEASPAVKVQGTRRHGAIITFCGNTLAERESAATTVQNESGATFIHPYDNDAVIAGQGSLSVEFLQQAPQLSVFIAPVGGGGLMSGSAIALRALKPGMQLIGVEPELAADAKISVETGNLQPPFPPQTVADGLRTALSMRTLGYLMRNHVHIATVSEKSIIEAMNLLMQELRVVVEPSGAVAFAYVLDNRHLMMHKQIGIVISGGNLEVGQILSGMV
ncbi:MAG: pyridoxal-phosphate dependent enzyme [Chlorobi bacterium]|nr:MAG: pyridoxal-phosphate dependent enzyme [Bacteroidota bacterium]MBE2265702.1 pyridoxal-phosphate dependent enzyme [Flavobacteriales bacterium]MBL1160883.1 pyridoxal-phosphate dependent enzyme [Chlorobiota bacterium]MBZ0193798.1 pyridoxal-phosphate dependent enzyme [Candidatus Kapabacteria bacterium]MCC6330925.1 pyridoxal-phosphate dependent enzyme [Ignavibacteria bacterium]